MFRPLSAGEGEGGDPGAVAAGCMVGLGVCMTTGRVEVGAGVRLGVTFGGRVGVSPKSATDAVRLPGVGSAAGGRGNGTRPLHATKTSMMASVPTNSGMFELVIRILN